MATADTTLRNAVQNAGEPQSRGVTDRRQHNRLAVVMLGRFMRESKHEFPCKMIDFSVGGATLMAPVEPDIGEKIIAYFDQLGGLEGSVVRNFTGGFAIQFTITDHKRDKLAAAIDNLLNKKPPSGSDARRHERLAPKSGAKSLTLAEGVTIDCDVSDMSISGASVVTTARPAVGAIVKLGNLNARVIRHHERGIALEFVDVQNPNAIRRYFG